MIEGLAVIGDQIAAHDPALAADHVDGRDRIVVPPRMRAEKHVALDQHAVGKAAVLAIALDMRVVVADAVVADYGAVGTLDDVEGMLASAVVGADSGNVEILEGPVGSGDLDELRRGRAQLDLTRMSRPNGDRPVLVQLHARQLVAPGRDGDDIARLGLLDRRDDRVGAGWRQLARPQPAMPPRPATGRQAPFPLSCRQYGLSFRFDGSGGKWTSNSRTSPSASRRS